MKIEDKTKDRFKLLMKDMGIIGKLIEELTEEDPAHDLLITYVDLFSMALIPFIVEIEKSERKKFIKKFCQQFEKAVMHQTYYNLLDSMELLLKKLKETEK